MSHIIRECMQTFAYVHQVGRTPIHIRNYASIWIKYFEEEKINYKYINAKDYKDGL